MGSKSKSVDPHVLAICEKSRFSHGPSLKTPPKPTNKTRLPPLSVAKLLRQKRLKNRKKLAENVATTLDGIQLSWNPTYNAPENYSFN